MLVRHGFLYLADLSPRIGTEPGKLRPVIVIQTDLLNQTGHPSTWIVPCTTQLTKENLLRVRLPARVAGNDRECDAMIDQSRAIDNRRLQKQLGKMPLSILQDVKDKLKLLGEL